MNKTPRISEAEWQIMKIIWSQSPITAAQIIDALDGQYDWKPKTVRALLSRLLNKEAIGFDKQGRTYAYYPLVSEEDCVKSESQSFLKRVYGGAINVMFASFLQEQDLTKDDIEELKRILEKKRGN